MSHRVVLSSGNSEQLNHTLNVISLTEKPSIVGSAKYLAHKYPGDIDVFEYALSKSNIEMASKEFSYLISNVAKIIYIDKTIKMVDFKAGIDPRFTFEELENIKHDINVDRISCFISRCKERGLLTKLEAQKLSECSYDVAKEFLRKLEFPHWTLQELILAKKELRGGVILTLKNAIIANARVKMDTISWFNSRLQAVEIVYLLAYTNEKGEGQPFFDMGDYLTGITKDINKYKLSNPLKTLKRLWSLSIFLDCDKLIEDLIPVFSTDAAALNQVVADIETLKMIREPLDKIMIVTLELRRRMQNHLTPEEFHAESSHEMIKTCDKIFALWMEYEKTKKFDYQKLRLHLICLEKFLKPLINEKSQPFYDRIKSDVKYCVKTDQLLL